jgi:DNA gyrase subunit A
LADNEKPPQGPPIQLPLGPEDSKNLIPINIEEEMRRSYLDYAMSVIVGRALPDVRDGLKPVHRRILYGMDEMGLKFNKSTRKCAKVVGDVMGNYHPHGDSAIYDALVRMAQPFSMRYPLIDGQGNFGSIDGDPPAAMRYTECRLSKIAAQLLEDIDKETVDFKPTYDDKGQEPEVLPTRVPNLLINGGSGIAVGMATNIPPHNLTEIVNATIALIQNPNTQLIDLMTAEGGVQGPDFPGAGFILGREGILNAYKTGRGSIKLRAKAATEKLGKDRESIVVTELPFQVNKSRLIGDTAGLVGEKVIEGISDIRDESDREGMRIVYELKRGENAEVVLNNLYKHTQLQINFGIIILAIVNGQPRELGLIDCLKRFIDHRIEVVRRRTDYLLRKAREREHILLGFQRALTNLDEVIRIIRAARNPKEAKEGLMEFITPAEAAEYAKMVGADPRGPRFSERQAQAIIELQLQRLTGMEQQKLIDELAQIQIEIAEYLAILGDDKKLKGVIVKELKEIQKEFGDERRTQIVDDPGAIVLEDLIQQEDVAVTVTRGGYLKRTPVDTYRRQTRGGKGRIGMGTRTEDVVEHLIIGSTHSHLLMFTNKGRLYEKKFYHIPDVGITGKGKNISGLINLQPDETVKAFLPVSEFIPGKYIVMVTKEGVIKKCELTEFDNIMTRGIIALSLDEGDELVSARLSTGEDLIFIATREGMSIKFPESDVRHMGRPARGVRGMALEEGDYVVAAEVVQDDALMLAISEMGYGKRTEASEYRQQSRGGKGVINMKTTKKTGQVVSVLNVREDSDVMLITKDGKIIRIDSADIRQAGRSTQGVRLLRAGDGDQVAAACLVPDEGDAPAGDDAQGKLIE